MNYQLYLSAAQTRQFDVRGSFRVRGGQIQAKGQRGIVFDDASGGKLGLSEVLCHLGEIRRYGVNQRVPAKAVGYRRNRV